MPTPPSSPSCPPSAPGAWRRCSNCKGPIALGAKYWMCSVSSCSKVRAPTQFCKPDCWAVHEEVAFHKSAWAVEHTAPKVPDPEGNERPRAPVSRPQAAPAPAPSASPASPRAAPPTASPPPPMTQTSTTAAGAVGDSGAVGDGGDDVLVVVSRLKELIRAESNGMSTSDQVVAPFSSHVRRLADLAIDSARRHDRKTVLDRDVPRLGPSAQREVLVVVSKLKDYVRRQSDLRTSDDVALAMSHELRRLVLFAIESARKDGRKTVMGRDVP